MGNSTARTAGIIIIGNEILSGKVQDVNSFYLTSELRTLGVDVRRISVIPDEIEVIGKEAVEFSSSYDHVFTSGGVGPTHDDVTMAGIAKGFGVRLVRHPDIERILCARYNDRLNEAVLKMAEVPEGSEIIGLGERRFPIVSFRNIFIFPGIPEHLMAKFTAIKERFRSSSFYLRRFFLNASESDIADILKEVVAMNSEVLIGSYPIVGNPEYKIMVTAESRSAEHLDRVSSELINRLPQDILVRME